MLDLALLLAALGLGFAIGYATREIVSRKRRASYRAYARFFERPGRLINGNLDSGVDDSRLRQEPRASLVMRVISSVALSVSLALALDFAVAVILILLLPKLL